MKEKGNELENLREKCSNLEKEKKQTLLDIKEMRR